jgi:hypothetical protein
MILGLSLIGHVAHAGAGFTSGAAASGYLTGLTAGELTLVHGHGHSGGGGGVGGGFAASPSRSGTWGGSGSSGGAPHSAHGEHGHHGHHGRFVGGYYYDYDYGNDYAYYGYDDYTPSEYRRRHLHHRRHHRAHHRHYRSQG